MIWIKLCAQEKSMVRIFLLVFVSGLVFCHEHDPSLPSACQMAPDTNDCGSKVEQRWFYHHNVRSCTEYEYRGCQRSDNNFNTKEECEKLCLPPFEEKSETLRSTVEQVEQKTEKKDENLSKEMVNVKETEGKNDQNEPEPMKTEKNDPGSKEQTEDSIQTEDIDNLVEEQDQLRKKFNMADSEDFLTLETLLQDRNNDEAVVITTNESEQRKTGDIVGKLYEKEEADDSNQVDDAQETTKEKVEKKHVKAEIVEFSDNGDADAKKEGDTNMEKTEIKEKIENSEVEELANEDEAIEEQIKEEEKLMDRYPMADADDMLALQEVVQSPSMEVLQEYTQDENIPEENMQEENQETQPSTAVDDSDVTNNKQEKLYEKTQDEEAARKEQFSMADDADYEALEELMASPNVQDVEMIVDSSEQYSDGNNRVLDIIDFHSGKISSEKEKDYYESESPEAGYGEHLDHTASEKEDHDNEAEATIKFEEKLEKKFNMADRDDMLSLEQIIQDPNMEMTDVVQENGDNRPGDINGVLSIAASFLGDHNKEETRNVEELREEIQQLPNVARTPINEVNAEIQKDFEEGLREKRIDFTHPAEKLKEQQESDSSRFPEGLNPVNFERMGHDDKMMLISLLHLDGLKVNKLPGTTTPILKPFKMQTNLLNSSPKEDFVDIMNLKGIRKCCLLPRDPGPCKNDRILQWHFDPMIGTCLPFFYGGCEGNRNRFDTIGECLRKCGPRDVSLESIPEPIPEPPTFKSAFSGLNSMVSNLVPGKILSLKEKMSPNQQKFIHKFIKSALKHITDIKPVKIGPMLPSLVLNKRIESAKKDIPTPLKSVMFKWPILRMVFDKRNNRVPFSGRSEARAGPIRLPVEKFMRPGPRDFRRVNNEPEEHPFSDFRKRGRDFEDSRKGGRDWEDSRKGGRDWEDSRKGGRDWEDSRKSGRDWEDRMRNKDRKDRKRGRDREERFFKKNSKHFSPSFKKSYKMMSHHEDNRHQISSDPKNKVNLIQVFVNKPNTEAHSSPSHHHTMIKKQFSPEPQIKAPLPPAPPVNRNTPPQSFSPQALTFPHAKPPMPPPPMMPPQNIPMNHQVPLVHRPHPHMMPPNNGIHHQHNHQYPIRPPFPPPHYHHSHPLPPPNSQTHFHVHQPFMHHPPPPFFDHQKPWWMRFERPFYKAPQSNRNLPHIIPSTGYPQKDLRESEERSAPEEKVMVVTVPPGTDDDSEPHYACLLPVSTGKCKAFLEKFYFNTATGRCELFIYGGCGGNANNFDSKEECQATCTGTSPVPKLEETTTRPDDTIIITSPVYVPSGEEEKAKETKKNEEIEPRKEEKSVEVIKQTEEKSHVHDESVKVEPVSLLKSSRMEYIIIIAVMCFVGLAVIILVALAVVSFLRKSNTSKKERVLEAVLSSHLEGRSIGSLTPRSHYYGQPPTETGPPPISDVPKIHKESFNEQL